MEDSKHSFQSTTPLPVSSSKSFEGRIATYQLKGEGKNFFREIEASTVAVLKQEVERHSKILANFTLIVSYKVIFDKVKCLGLEEKLVSEPKIFTEESDYYCKYKKVHRELIEKYRKFKAKFNEKLADEKFILKIDVNKFEASFLQWRGKSEKVTLVVYAQFECLKERCRESNDYKHSPFAFSYVIVENSVGDFDPKFVLDPVNCVQEFWKNLQSDLMLLKKERGTLPKFIPVFIRRFSQYASAFLIKSLKGNDNVSIVKKSDQMSFVAIYKSNADVRLRCLDYDQFMPPGVNVEDLFPNNVTNHLPLTKTLSLAEAFENLRKICWQQYALDPANFCTMISFNWEAMLKFTKVQLEPLIDSKMVKFLKKNIRPGITQCNKRHAKASKQPPTFIAYLDANNLAGWAMSQQLPIGEFSWLSEEEVENFDINREVRDYGFILEVDLEYPQELHSTHNSLPFCSEYINVTPYFVWPNLRENRFIANLRNKKNYVIYYKNLQQCLEHGLKLTKIHRVLTFKHSNWLEGYVDKNTVLRQKASNCFENKFYKWLNNTISGKLYERDRVTTKISTHWNRASDLVSNYKKRYVVNEDVAIFELDEPIMSKTNTLCAGFVVQELAKFHMYNFHYNVMLKKYREKLRLVYMDTDAFFYEIDTEDFYADLENDEVLSSYFHSSVLGKMKDETKGRVIKEFYSTGAKYYYYVYENGEEVKKAAKVSEKIKKKLKMADFEKCIKNAIPFVDEDQVTEISENFEIITRTAERLVLVPHDYKREILDNKIDTNAIGFKSRG